MGELFIVVAVVALAGGWLAWRWARSLRPNQAGGCGCGCGCSCGDGQPAASCQNQLPLAQTGPEESIHSKHEEK